MDDPEISTSYKEEAKRLHRTSAYNVAFTSYSQVSEQTEE